MCLPPPDFLAFPWHFYAPGLASRFRIPLTPIHLFLLDDISSFQIYSVQLFITQNARRVKSRPTTSDAILFCSSNLWVNMLEFYRELLNYADSPLKISKCDLASNQDHLGEGWAFSGNLDCISRLHVFWMMRRKLMTARLRRQGESISSNQDKSSSANSPSMLQVMLKMDLKDQRLSTPASGLPIITVDRSEVGHLSRQAADSFSQFRGCGE